MSKINKNDIINEVSNEAYLSIKDAKAAVDLTFEIIANALKEGESVNIANFATFSVKERKARVGTDPETHQKIEIKSRKMVSMKLSKELKKKINDEK